MTAVASTHAQISTGSLPDPEEERRNEQEAARRAAQQGAEEAARKAAQQAVQRVFAPAPSLAWVRTGPGR
ncbi:hypothetical protein [Streptomyces sp. NPDC018833]|uniref:hypothetical protein n=1 Tax=Streptomyces sp. NPDC018833 TaxID=3365053 RepID=UPI0037ABBBA2